MKGNMSRVNGALYPFGYGLSYTTFEYSDLSVSPKVITPKQEVTVKCKVTNTGDREGDEVVQLYTRDVISSVTTYEKNLRGFERIHLKPGESKEVTFTIYPRDLELYNADNRWVVEPGEFKVMIGASSLDIRLNDIFEVREYNGKPATVKENKTGNSPEARVLDGDQSTAWLGAKGDYLTFAMQDNAKPDKISILWKTISEPTAFEIQVSSGGGQFITVYEGKANPSDKFISYPLKKDVASDVRVLITKGKAEIAEIKLDKVKK